MGTRRPIAAALAAATIVAGASAAHANESNTVDSSDDVGVTSALAIAPDGYPVIAYYDSANDDLKLFDCDDAACSSGTTTVVEDSNDVGQTPAIVIGADGFPIIAHYDGTNLDLRVFDCSNATCTAGSAQKVDEAGNVGFQPSMVLGNDNNPIIAYRDATTGSLKVADCSTPDCSVRVVNTLDSANNAGLGSSMVLGNDNNPIIAYWAVNGDVRVYDCANPACSAGGAQDIDTAIAFFFTRTSMVLGLDGNPYVAYTDIGPSDSYVADCNNPACTTRTTTTLPDATTTTMVLGSDGFPIILSWASLSEPLKIYKCNNATCSARSTGTVADTEDSGAFPSMVLGMDSSPVFSYRADTSGDLAVYDCSTPTCSPRIIERLSGPTRIETAIAASQNAFGVASADGVVLARADLYPDALVGGPLAAIVDGPLLLTPSNSLPATVLVEIGRILPPGKSVHVLGGTAAISEDVTDELESAGYVIVRYAGSNRYATATQVANAIDTLVGPAPVALLASGTNFPDALAASAVGAANFYPVLLTNDDQPVSATTAWLASFSPADVACAGGPACTAYPASTIKLVGSDRYETAALVGEEFFAPTQHVGLASGERFPDALVAAADSFNRGGPLVLTRATQLPSATEQFIDMTSPFRITIYGGNAAVSPGVEAALAN